MFVVLVCCCVLQCRCLPSFRSVMFYFASYRDIEGTHSTHIQNHAQQAHTHYTQAHHTAFCAIVCSFRFIVCSTHRQYTGLTQESRFLQVNH